MIFIDRQGKAWHGELIECNGCQMKCLRYETIRKTDKEVDPKGKRRYSYAYEVEVGLYAGMNICTECGSKWGEAKSE
jgi:hypothetical protein